MKIAGSVILYNPNENTFKNILTYLKDIGKLYIFDNSINKTNKIPKEIIDKSVYVHTGINEGIGKRLNEAIAYSKNDGFDFLLTMDQDSAFKEGDFNAYLTLLKNENNKNIISMYGVRYSQTSSKNKNQKHYNQPLITSGSIVNIEIANKLNGFDENLFIDRVDTDFCLNSYKNNFQTVCYNEISLTHSIGDEKNVLTPSFKIKSRRFHNPIRLYYIVRNHIYLIKKYPKLSYHLKKMNLKNELKNCLLYGGNPIKYTYAIVLALIHAKRDILGKLKNKYEIQLAF